MDDYLLKHGFDPDEFGLTRYLKTNSSVTEKADKTDGENSWQKRNDFSNTKLDDLPLTMVYIPMQKLKEKYNEEKALCAGTLFPELDKPFLGKKIK